MPDASKQGRKQNGTSFPAAHRMELSGGKYRSNPEKARKTSWIFRIGSTRSLAQPPAAEVNLDMRR
jgi:hypothetical protein